MPARGKVRHVEILRGHLRHGSRISENMALALVGQQDRYARCFSPVDPLDTTQVDTLLRQPFNGYAAQCVIPNPGDETN